MKMSTNVNFTNVLQPTSNFFFSPHEFRCSSSTVGRYILTTISFTCNCFILPLSVFVLYLGFQRWRQQHSVPTAAIMTHSDFFTYNMAVMELVGVFGHALYYCSSYADLPVMQLVGFLSKCFTWLGQIFFPILTCAEHYLAVVHPVTYRGLKQANGIRIRNITAGSTWLICFVWMGAVIPLNMYFNYNLVVGAFMFSLSLIIMLFCSFSVLRVLIRPLPGKGNRDRVQVDQSKKKAFYIILIIMGVLWLKFGGGVVAVLIRISTLISVRCVGEGFIHVFNLAGSLVLPLLYLQRAGKLPNCKHNNESGLSQN